MSQPLTSIDPLLVTIVLGTLAIGLPIVLVLAIRFLWDRNLNLGRSKELEKLIWQLHRIASAMEHQLNLSFPAVQPGTEEPHDLAYLEHQVARQAPPAVSVAAPSAAIVSPPSTQPPTLQEPAAPAAAEQQAPLPALERREPSVEVPRAGVNSMFGL